MTRVDRSKHLGEDRISSLLIKFSVPAMVGMIVNASYNVVDRIFIGHGVGTLGIAGVTIGFPMMLVMMAFAMLIGLGGAALISIRLGEQKHDEAELVLGNGMVLLVVCSLLISILGLMYLDPLLRFFSATEEVLPFARDYMRIIIGGAVFQGISFGGNAYIRAEGNPRTAMATMLIGAGLNAILAPIFIFLFKWGMQGAGLATVIAQMVSAIWVVAYFLTGRSHLVLKTACMRLKSNIVKTTMMIGSPPFAMQMVASMIMIVFNHSLEKYGGDTAISAMGVVNAIAMMILMPIFGINQGSQPIIGYNYGAKKYDRVLRTLRHAIVVASAIALFGFIIIRIFPIWVIRLFNDDDPQLIALGSRALVIFLTCLPLIGFQTVSASYFLAVGKPSLSMALTLSRQVIFLLPALLVLPGIFGLNGIFYAGPTADFLSSLLTGIFITREIRLLRRQHAEPQVQPLSFV